MNFLIIFFIGVLGLFIGSFLNVVIYRFNTGRSIVYGRSSCMTCTRHLSWYELIPVFSYLFQKGKCRNCKSIIDHQYPIVEFLTAIIFTMTAMKFSSLSFVAPHQFVLLVTGFMFFFSLVIVIGVYDLKHSIIPNILVYLLSFVALLISLTLGRSLLSSITSGIVVALPLALLFFYSKGLWIGFGDSKLAFAFGILLGTSAGLACLMISFWIGAIISIFLLLARKRKFHIKSAIPFAPFLILAFWLVFFNNLTILGVLSWFS